jgi:hypothetical protein
MANDVGLHMLLIFVDCLLANVQWRCCACFVFLFVCVCVCVCVCRIHTLIMISNAYDDYMAV